MKTAEIIIRETPSKEESSGRQFILLLQILDSNIRTKSDVITAIKKAVKHYVTSTKQGKANFEYNCKCFNWADFESSVPNKICQKYGFTKVEQKPDVTLSVDWDEQLC